MSPNRVITSFSRHSDAELSTKSNEIISSVTGNQYFQDAGDLITSLVKAKQEYDENLVGARSGDSQKIAVKNEKRKILVAQLIELARYIEMVAKANRPILLSSGFDITKERASAVTLDEVQNLKLSDGNESGELYCTITSVNGAKSYLYQYTADPITAESIWTSETATVSSHLFKGLPSNKRIWCKVVAIGSNNQRTVSEQVSRVVQ